LRLAYHSAASFPVSLSIPACFSELLSILLF
jgi:hypothetical protein